jgi:hypothetical protein
VPAELSVRLVRPFGQELVIVEGCSLADQLAGDRCTAPLIEIGAQIRSIAARQHCIDEAEIFELAAVRSTHVAKVAAHVRHLATDKTLEDRFDGRELRFAHYSAQSQVTITLEALDFG